MKKNKSTGKQWLAFFLRQNDVGMLLFFLLVSTGLWIMLRLNGNESERLRFPVRYRMADGIRLPDGFIGDTIQVKWEGNVWDQFRWQKNWKNRLVDLPAEKKGSITAKLKEEWKDETGGQIIWPDETVLQIDRWKWKKIPVKVEGQFIPQPHYAIRSIRLKPDSVWVFVPVNRNFPSHLSTQPVKREGIAGEIQETLSLDVPPGLKVYPTAVEAVVQADLFEEKTVKKPISLPPGWQNRLLLMPQAVEVHYKKWIHGRTNDEKWTFVPELDSLGHSEKLPVRLLEKPASVFWWEYYPRQVDYILLENE